VRRSKKRKIKKVMRGWRKIMSRKKEVGEMEEVASQGDEA